MCSCPDLLHNNEEQIRIKNIGREIIPLIIFRWLIPLGDSLLLCGKPFRELVEAEDMLERVDNSSTCMRECFASEVVDEEDLEKNFDTLSILENMDKTLWDLVDS